LLNNKVVLELCLERAQAREMAYRDSVYLSSSFLHKHFVSLHSPFSLPAIQKEEKKAQATQPKPIKKKKNHKKTKQKRNTTLAYHCNNAFTLFDFLYVHRQFVIFLLSFEILQIIHHVCWFFL